MTAPVRPNATKQYLRDKWVFVPTLTSTTAPSLAELNAASALDVTKMLCASSARPTQSTNLATAPKRLGDGVTYEFVGETSLTLGELRYSFNPQGVALSNEVKAYEKFVPGTTGWMVNRLGIDRDTDLALGQFISGYPVEFGEQQETPEGDAEGAEVGIVQTVAITGPKFIKKAIAA